MVNNGNLQKNRVNFRLYFFIFEKKEKIVHFSFTVINVRVSKIKLRNTPVPWLLQISLALFSLVQSYKKFPNCLMQINISSVVEFQRWWVLKSKIFAMWWLGSKDFIWRAPEAHKNEFLNYDVLKISWHFFTNYIKNFDISKALTNILRI